MAATSTTRRNTNFYRDYALTGYQTAKLTFWSVTGTLAGGTDYARVEYSTNGGANWTQIMNLTAASAAQTRTIDIPAGGTTRVRFSGSYNATTEYSAFDNITVQGFTTGTGAVALPANSTAQVSCQDNPNGTECHSVTDVRTLHAGTTAKCTACHNATFSPTATNCQNTGCHVGVNLDEHTATGLGTPVHHENGGNFASFATTSECAGCHDDSVAKEHSVLTRQRRQAVLGLPCHQLHGRHLLAGQGYGHRADHREEHHLQRLPHDLDADLAARPAPGHEQPRSAASSSTTRGRATELLDHAWLAHELRERSRRHAHLVAYRLRPLAQDRRGRPRLRW